MTILTPELSRTARAWLGWSQTNLANKAGVSLSTVRDFELKQRQPIPNNLLALQRAIENAGVKLLFDQQGQAAGICRDDFSFSPSHPDNA